MVSIHSVNNVDCKFLLTNYIKLNDGLKTTKPCKSYVLQGFTSLWEFVVIATGFEPVTVCLEGRCSIQLSYATILFYFLLCRGGRIRTCDLLVPNEARWPGYATPRKIKKSGETGTRTLATVTRRQISNLLHYHSGTSPKYVYELIFASANVTLEMHLHNIFFTFFT